MAFKLRYQEDALADLEALFDWSRDQHPGSTELFANDLFNHLDLLSAFPYVGATVEGEPNLTKASPAFTTLRLLQNRRSTGSG